MNMVTEDELLDDEEYEGEKKENLGIQMMTELRYHGGCQGRMWQVWASEVNRDSATAGGTGCVWRRKSLRRIRQFGRL